MAICLATRGITKMTDFASTLKRQRQDAGLSQSALARLAGVHPSYISRLEKGDRGPANREFIEKLATVLGAGIREKNELLLAAGFAPVILADLRRENPTLQLLADILEDDVVPREEKDLIAEHIRQINRRWRRRDF
jgi:transcriptional regulator with XRE-family HTH domain